MLLIARPAAAWVSDRSVTRRTAARLGRKLRLLGLKVTAGADFAGPLMKVLRIFCVVR